MVSNTKVLNVVAFACRWVYRRIDHIVVLSPGFKRLLVERGVASSKIDVIYNWADEAALTAARGSLHQAFPGPEQFRVLFAGNMGKAQALDTILDAARMLQEQGSRVCWVLLGSGVEAARLKQKAQDMQLRNVVFLPPVPMAEVGRYLNAADALLVHLRRDPLFEITIPSKTQAYMAVGKPVLMAVGGDAADLVRNSGAGVIAESENAVALADAAERLATMSPTELAVMDNRAQSYYREHLALPVGVRKFGTIFQRLAEPDKMTGL